ncbi:hypothetical protein K439DRAFT_792169 [Ramaria rubella]|nr:hypothetical protein K439DRAFT_792169 [Ramaria rubella]
MSYIVLFPQAGLCHLTTSHAASDGLLLPAGRDPTSMSMSLIQSNLVQLPAVECPRRPTQTYYVGRYLFWVNLKMDENPSYIAMRFACLSDSISEATWSSFWYILLCE